jgi:hypothetical protein
MRYQECRLAAGSVNDQDAWLLVHSLANLSNKVRTKRMIAEIRDALSACITDPPDDLVALYTATPLRRQDLRIRIRDLSDAIAYTRAIHERVLIGRPMQLFALDDANDSNPYCYINRGAARGCILHLYHDNTPSIEYSSLAAFLDALSDAIECGRDIDELSGKDVRPPVDQKRLCDEIAEMAESGTSEAECELIVLCKLLATDNVEAVGSLARQRSCFVREAVAELVASYPAAKLLDVAEALANDPHVQVARAGKKAYSAVKRLTWKR